MGKGVRWRRGLIHGAIDIVRGGRLSQIPLRDGVLVCLLVEGRLDISRKYFRLRRRICLTKAKYELIFAFFMKIVLFLLSTYAY